MSIEERLQTVFCDVFGPQLTELSDETSTETVDGWDSAKHLALILALEAEFGIEFETDEIADLTSVGAIRARLSIG